mgnify:CR=1 FL=1
MRIGAIGAVLLLGSNLAETMPPAVGHLAGARERVETTEVVDTRSNQVVSHPARPAVLADVMPGVDLAGMGRTALAANRPRRCIGRGLDVVVDVTPRRLGWVELNG